jgi:hypothetical protein
LHCWGKDIWLVIRKRREVSTCFVYLQLQTKNHMKNNPSSSSHTDTQKKLINTLYRSKKKQTCKCITLLFFCRHVGAWFALGCTLCFLTAVFSAGFLTHTHTHTNTKKKVGDFSVYVNIKTVRVKNQTNTHTTTTQTHTNREKIRRTDHSIRWAKTFFMRPLLERGLRWKKNIPAPFLCTTVYK